MRPVIRLLIWAALLLPPRAAATVVGWVGAGPEAAAALEAVCERESRCQRVGLHPGDARWGWSSWGGMVQLGRLRPWCQPRGGPGRGYAGPSPAPRSPAQPRPGARWSTRGAFGLNTAVWGSRYLPICYWPELFDVPIVSAYVAMRLYTDRCPGMGWCPRHRKG